MTTNGSPPLAIIGGASLDWLSFQGRRERSIGGAGLYTALAAARAGAQVTMFAPRPDPMPPELAPVAARVNWVGPIVPPDELPSFEIAHYGNGKAELVSARWGAESLLSPDKLPSGDLPGDIVYCGPLADPARQLAFIRHVRARGRRTAVGTYARAVKNFRDTVLQTFLEADIFFCNENEAQLLWGDFETAVTVPGKLLFITRGERGARILQGEYHSDVPSLAIAELDPTGAGDTFCGTTLAQLAQGAHPVQAARQGCAGAAEMVTAIGPTKLFEPPSPPDEDPRVVLDDSQILRVAALISRLPKVEPFDFVGADFPPVGHPAALDYFFAAVLEQFGFWFLAEREFRSPSNARRDNVLRYHEPFVAALDGTSYKGSDYLWAVYRRWLESDPDGLTPARQRDISALEFESCYQSDAGEPQMPQLQERWRLARAYGSDMTALDCTPAQLVAQANASAFPLQTFLSSLDYIGGYKEDPLRKKSVLLALILRQRPEKFLRVNPDEEVPPVIDYHLQRSCLRIGLIQVTDEKLRQAIISRELLPAQDEWAIRWASYRAIAQVQRASGKSMGAVDWFFFGARRRCPEMSEPECSLCAVDPVCAHRKDLFQPVLRTTFY